MTEVLNAHFDKLHFLRYILLSAIEAIQFFCSVNSILLYDEIFVFEVHDQPLVSFNQLSRLRKSSQLPAICSDKCKHIKFSHMEIFARR